MNIPRSVLAALVFLTSAGVANAAVVNKIVTFSANSFQSGFGAVAPVDPVTGSFNISFDDSLDYANSIVGISLNSLNIALGSALSFNYIVADDRLEVGGISGGADFVFYSPAANDFWLFIDDFLSGTPLFDQVGYAQASINNQIWYTVDHTGSVTVNDAPAVPLPAALPMLISAIGGLALLRRRRGGMTA